jgi:hypothetical protein
MPFGKCGKKKDRSLEEKREVIIGERRENGRDVHRN